MTTQAENHLTLIECECEHAEPPEPEEHDVRFKGHDINVSKDSLSANWYIRVTHPNGSYLYDGWWRDSSNATWQEAIEEAKQGAMLNRPKEHPMTDTTPAPIGEDALREALWICVEHNALHFGETHNTVVQGRAALANSAPKAAPAPAVEVGGPLNELEELNLLNKLIELGARAANAHAKANSDDGQAGTAAYAEWNELRACMRELIRKAQAAPQPASPSYTHADVLEAHTNGYELGMRQQDRATKPAPAAQGDALYQGVREELSIGKAINRAARDLPEGWEIRIDLEQHAGVVFLIDPNGNETMSESGELFSDQINAAIAAATGAKLGQ